jgi:hypothetical protein
MELTLVHKERMKDKEMERECIRFGKAKDNNYTKLLAEEQKHLNIQERVDNRYEKTDSAKEKKHTGKRLLIERMWVPPSHGLPKPPLMSRWQATMVSFQIREEWICNG